MTDFIPMIPGIAGCVLALVAIAISVRTVRAHKQGVAAELDEMRAAGERSGRELTAAISALQSTEEMLQGARLGRSARSKALQMLRSGASPQSVAESMGLGVRETQLLASVSELLLRQARRSALPVLQKTPPVL